MAEGGRGGSIVTITSIEAHRAAPGYAVYAAMKAAVTHLTRTLAVELGAAGIRINCVAPDFVPTAGLAAIAGRAGSAGQRAAAAGDGTDPGDWLTIPLRRKGEVADVGNCRAVPRLGPVVVHHGHDAAPRRRRPGHVGLDGVARRRLHGPSAGVGARPPRAAWPVNPRL